MAKRRHEFHESFDRKEKVVLGSDKKFGYTFAIVLFLISISPSLINLKLRFVLIIFSLLFLAAALLDPSRLHPVNEAWAKLGLLLNKVISPVILAVLFFFAFLPVGLVLRLFKKDILDMKISKSERSYWIDSRKLIETSMKDQF